MRVTNSMISDNSRTHISNAKNKLLNAEEQYTSGKKIQRPSDDPITAVRALKFRTTYAQITQYAEKNVNDAMEWMDTTETAMSNISSILTNMKGNLSEGASDDLETDNRTSVLQTLQQYVSSIFEDEANTDYAGRYVFTGYRTETSLIFGEETTNLAYDITENFEYDDVELVSVVTGGATYDATVTDGQAYVDKAATKSSIYRIQLAYDNCSNSGLQADGTTPTGTKEDYVKFNYSYKDASGNTVTVNNTATTKASTDADAYIVGDDDIVYLNDTGEILLGKNVYASLQSNQAEVSVEYCKTSFEKGDIRPEMYFECSSYDSVSEKTVKYADPDGQDIDYEVNFDQTVTVNTQAKDAISTDIYRSIDYIAQTIEDVEEVESKISEVKNMISNTTDEATLATLNSLKTTLESELTLRKSVMTAAFGKGLTMVDKAQQQVSEQTAVLGSKYNRMELTSDKLLDQQTDTYEKMSDNEDVEIADSYLALNTAQNLYQASLSATSKILGNTLLDYI